MLNKIELIGRLGVDPEMRYMPNGGAVCNISLATSRTWKNKETDERQEETEWHRVVFYNRTAEVVGEYLKKGSLIYVEGRNKTRKWQDENGVDRYSTEIIANTMQMLDTKSDSNHGNPPPQGSQQPQQQQRNNQQSRQQPAQQQRQQSQQMPPQAPPDNYDDFNDEVPF